MLSLLSKSAWRPATSELATRLPAGELKRRLMIILFAVGVMSLAASANAVCVPGAPQLIIYHAGSLSAAFAAAEQLFTQQTGVCVTDVAAGSVDAARRITTGQEPCDIFASADFELST